MLFQEKVVIESFKTVEEEDSDWSERRDELSDDYLTDSHGKLEQVDVEVRGLNSTQIQ